MIRNLTPHTITLLREDPDGDITGYAGYGTNAVARQYRALAEYPSEGVARATTTVTTVGTLPEAHDVPVTCTRFGFPEGLPAQQREVWLIVSLVTAQQMYDSGRSDLLTPGELVRNSEGQIIGCTGFGTMDPARFAAAGSVVA